MSSEYMTQAIKPQYPNSDTNSIIIKVGEVWGNNSRIEITPWAQGMSWLLRERLDDRYEFGIWEIPYFSFDFIEKKASDSGQVFSIPDEVKLAINQFKQQSENYFGAALWFVSRSIEAKELLLDLPFIFWCVLEYSKTQDLEVDEIFALLGEKRKVILNNFGIDGTKSQINLLKKLKYRAPFTYSDIEHISHFFKIVSDQQLVKFEYLNVETIVTINEHPELLKNKWLYHLNENLSVHVHNSIVSVYPETIWHSNNFPDLCIRRQLPWPLGQSS